MAVNITSYVWFEFQVGPNLYCEVRHRTYDGSQWRDPIITRWRGSGDMYSNINDFTLLAYAPGFRSTAYKDLYVYMPYPNRGNVSDKVYITDEECTGLSELVTGYKNDIPYARGELSYDAEPAIQVGDTVRIAVPAGYIGPSTSVLSADSSQSEYIKEPVTVNGDTFKVGVYFEENIVETAETGLWSSFLFSNDYSMKWKMTIPSGVITIPAFAFAGWKLKHLTLPDSLEVIYGYAFQGCFGYTVNTDLIIPSTVSYLGDRCFDNCPGIKTIDFSRNSILTNNVRSISYYAFHVNGDTPGYPIPTVVKLGNSSIKNLPWNRDTMVQGSWGRNVTFVDKVDAHYVCWDPVNGTQTFPLYKDPGGDYNRVFYAVINGVGTNLYLPMVPMSDTVNGGNRVQYVPLVGSMRFRKT